VPKKSRRSQTSPTSNEEEVLNRQVDTTGNDPSPVVNALMSQDFIQGSNLDVSQIALLLQQLVRGQNSLLANYEQTNIEIAKLRERQDQIDKQTAERFAAQQSEIAEVLNKAEKLKATGDKKDKIVAKGAQMYTQAVQAARASKTVDKLKFEKALAAQPTELVVSPGQLVTVMEAGQQVAKIIPEEVRIKHKVWFLQPGVPTEVPQSVADFLRARRAGEAETAKRKEILSKHMEAGKMAAEWQKVGGSKTSSMPQ
jgi:hypothetical protein